MGRPSVTQIRKKNKADLLENGGLGPKTSPMLSLMNTLILFVILSPGAISVQKGEVTFRPGPLEASVPERFRMGPADFRYEFENR